MFVMREADLRLPAIDERRIEQAIDDAIAASGLWVSQRGTLKKCPGCVHWHVRNGREAGTLEVTFWPSEQRVWFTVQRGRAAGWITDGMRRIRRAIQDVPAS
jgi:hypothetical protein